MLFFEESYGISLGKSNESCFIFGHYPMECKTTNGQQSHAAVGIFSSFPEANIFINGQQN